MDAEAKERVKQKVGIEKEKNIYIYIQESNGKKKKEWKRVKKNRGKHVMQKVSYSDHTRNHGKQSKELRGKMKGNSYSEQLFYIGLPFSLLQLSIVFL